MIKINMKKRPKACMAGAFLLQCPFIKCYKFFTLDKTAIYF